MKVYLIKSIESASYKIGISKNPKQRLSALQTGNPELIVIVHEYETQYPYKLETALHNYFRIDKKQNEWFSLGLNEELNFVKICDKINANIQIVSEPIF